MKIKIIAFGVAREILGGKNIDLTLEGSTVGDLREQLFQQHPKLEDLKSLYIAVNQNYAEEVTLLNETDEIALIPPVAGG